MIAFTRPWFLLLLIIPLLWILFLAFNRRRSKADVPSTLIWKQVLQSRSQRRFHSRSRLNLLLLLQLTVLLSGIMALAGFSFYSPPQQNLQDLIIVIDTTASMQVTQGGISRFTRARNAAIEIVNAPVEENGGSRRIALIELAARPRIIHRFTEDRTAVTAALRSLTPSDEAGEADTALQLAYDLRSPASDTGVLLLSDGAFQLAGEYPGLQVRLFGEPAANNGISRFSIRKVPRRENEYQVLCEFFSSSEGEPGLSYSLLQNGTTILSNETARSADRILSRVHSLRGQPGDIFRLQLDRSDALEADNTAYGVIPQLPRPKVLCVTPGNLFLENFFAVFDEADAFISNDPIVKGLYDVVLFDGPLGSLSFPAAVLKIDSRQTQNPDEASGNLTTAAFAHQVSDHPVLAGLDFTGLSSLVDPQAVIRMPADSRILVRSAGRPLITASENGSRRLQVHFDLRQSDLPYSPIFPVFMSNAVWWAYAGMLPERSAVFRTGSPIRFPHVLSDGRVQFGSSTGNGVSARITNHQLEIGRIRRAGLYREQSFGGVKIGVNLLSAEESDLTPRLQINAAPAAAAAQPNPSPRPSGSEQAGGSTREFWQLLVAVMLLAAAAEWLVSHTGRRPE